MDLRSGFRFARFAIATTLLVVGNWTNAEADIYRWDNGQLIPGTEAIIPGPGVQLDHWDLAFANFDYLNLTGASFSASNLQDAMFYRAHMFGADFFDADVRGSHFGRESTGEGTGIMFGPTAITPGTSRSSTQRARSPCWNRYWQATLTSTTSWRPRISTT